MSETSRLQEARSALCVVSARTESLLTSLPDTTGPIAGTTWSVRDATVHLAVVGFRYAGIVVGEANPYPSLDPAACARLHDQFNADISESGPAALAGLLHEATASLLGATAACHDTYGVRFPGETVIAVPDLVAVALAEHLLHGSDMAFTAGRPWPIEPLHAALARAASGPGYGLGCPSASPARERNFT